MKKLLTSLMSLMFIGCILFPLNTVARDEQSIFLISQKKDYNKTKYPQKPAYTPLHCVVTNEDVTVYCEYETTGDILIVDSRTGMTVASESGVELGDGYTICIPESEAETPLTIYVTLGDITYWAEI